MKTKILLNMAGILLFLTCQLKADLVYDSGYNIFDDSYPYYAEVWVINDAVLDVLAGSMGKLELKNYATSNIYGGEIQNMLAIQGNSTANIHGGLFNLFAAGDNALAYLYAYDVIYHPTGGTTNDGWLEGRFYSNDTYFSFSFYTGSSHEHLNVVPEPATLMLFSLSGLLLKKNRIKY